MAVVSAWPEPEGETPAPGRLLLLTGTMGEGHNVAARALEEAAHRIWPRCVIGTRDVLEFMGPGAGASMRGAYVTNVQSTPWLYELFFTSLHRMRWFAHASNRVVGTWAAVRLADEIEAFQPDLIVSTYHVASAALATLRRRGELSAPAATWVTDFAPHPLWMFAENDLTFVLHEASAATARAVEPGARVRVAAPPVGDAFAPGDRRAARERLGWAADEYALLLSAGSYGFGEIDATVDAMLAADDDARVVVICGRNARLAERLRGRGLPGDRLTVLGWVDEMPAYLHAADVVVTNAGGSTVLEALACGRAVVTYRPIAAHGTNNSALLASAGLARYPVDEREFAEVVREMRAPTMRVRYEKAARAYATAHRRADDLRAFAACLERPHHRAAG